MSEIKLYQDPKTMEAIRYYTDPTLPTFGNKSASAAAAGLATASCFTRSEVQQEIDRIIQERLEKSERTVEYVGTYAMDAARELVSQMSTGRDLKFVEMEEIQKVIDSSDADEGKKLAAIVRHNKVVLEAYEQRRKAAVEILRQQIGTPEQRIKVDHGASSDTMLDNLKDEQLQELSKLVSEELNSRKPQVLEAEEIPEADYL
jgi:hypothetical protein